MTARLELQHRLGMGCWQLGGASDFGGRVNGYGELADATAFGTVEAALESGIRFFDTSNAYGRGRSERLLGQALQGHRDEVMICTKFGAREDTTGHSYLDFSTAHLHEALSASLERLRTDHVDVLLLHGPPDDTDWSLLDRRGLDEAVSSGLIGSYGVSVRSLHGAKRVAEAGFGSWIEVVFNLLDRRAAALHSLMQSNGQSIIARVPLASGFLSDRMLRGTPAFAQDDIRSTMPSDQRDWMMESVERLRPLMELPGGLSTSALRYVLYHPSIAVAIPGMRSPEQVALNRAALDLGPLPVEVIEQVEEAIPEVFHRWR